MTRLLAIVLALASLSATAARADDAAMRAAATGFYAVVLPDISGIPDTATRARLTPTITPALAALLNQAAMAEDRFMAANKNAPPLMEGDLFSSLFEGATAFTVGDCGGDNSKGHCAVALTYDDKSGKPVHWTDTLYLTNAGGWRVNDVGYGGNWDFGNKGRLSETLKQIVENVSP